VHLGGDRHEPIRITATGRGAAVMVLRWRPEDRAVARIPLEPVELPGPWWRRHRHWLATPVPFAGARPTVVNARTGEAHPWVFRGNYRGRGWFGVRTRWARLHPAWKREPWVVVYDHPAPDGGPGRRGLQADEHEDRHGQQAPEHDRGARPRRSMRPV